MTPDEIPQSDAAAKASVATKADANVALAVDAEGTAAVERVDAETDGGAPEPTTVTPIQQEPRDPLAEPWPNAWKFYRGLWAFWLLLASGAVGYIVVRATVPEMERADEVGPETTCLMKAATGVPCPFCGGTRSATWTLQGRIERAVFFQPLGPLYLFLFAASIPLSLCGIAAPARTNLWFRRWILRRRMIFGFIALTLGIWLARAIVTEEALLDYVEQREAASARP